MIEIPKRKYIPLNKKYPTILGLVKMREGKVFTLMPDSLHLKWNGILTTLEYRGERVSVHSPALQKAVMHLGDDLVRIGHDVTMKVVDTVQSVHDDHHEKPREEKVIRLTINNQSVYLVLDELAWFCRAM